MSKHWEHVSWHTHLHEKKHGCFGIVKTDSEKTLAIGIYDGSTTSTLWGIPRPVASMLAKRIIQCLKETR